MRTFIFGWIVAFCVVAVGATVVGRMVASVPPPTPEPVRRIVTFETGEEAGPFREADGVDVVSRRIATTSAGDQLRRELQGSAKVSYHSPQHWRVCLEDACWVAHGPGRYAEPENDAAQRREVLATTGQ